MPSQQFFAPVGLALASDESGFKDRAIALDGKNDAIGVGNGRNFRDGRKRLNPVIWIKGEEVAGTPGTDVDSKKDNIIIVKFEFGDTDKVSTWYFTEDQKMTEAAFDQHAARCSGSIDENTLDVLTIGTILKDNAIDEIRIGTSFESVITGNIPPRQEVRITKCQHDETSDSYEIVGFSWHQGTSDKSPPAVAEEYKYNLPDFIQAVRSEFGKPDLPFVIATTGMADVGPVKPYPYEGYHPVERAQLWVAGAEKPRNVLTDDTRGCWESVENSPVNQGFHWNQNARSYFRVGLGLGNDMVKLLEQ